MRRDKRWTGGDPDELPERESMKARYANGWHYKDRSAQVNPMTGFLRKSCGRLWDDVYSEVCRTSRRKLGRWGTPRDMCDDLVEKNTYELYGKVYVENTGRRILGCREYETRYQDPVTGFWIVRMKQVYPVEQSWCKFYVHPTTGVLYENVRYAKKLTPKDGNPDVLVADEWYEYHKIAGLWYEIRFSPFPSEAEMMTEPTTWVGRYSKTVYTSPGYPTNLGNFRDMLTGLRLIDSWETKHLPWHEWRYENGRHVFTKRVRPARFAGSKWLLAKKELRKLGLKNG